MPKTSNLTAAQIEKLATHCDPAKLLLSWESNAWAVSYPADLAAAVAAGLAAAAPAAVVPVNSNFRASFTRVVATRRVWTEVNALVPLDEQTTAGVLAAVGGRLRIDRKGLYHIAAWSQQGAPDDGGIAIRVNGNIVTLDTVTAWAGFTSAASASVTLGLRNGDFVSFDVAADQGNRTVVGEVTIARIGD